MINAVIARQISENVNSLDEKISIFNWYINKIESDVFSRAAHGYRKAHVDITSLIYSKEILQSIYKELEACGYSASRFGTNGLEVRW